MRAVTATHIAQSATIGPWHLKTKYLPGTPEDGPSANSCFFPTGLPIYSPDSGRALAGYYDLDWRVRQTEFSSLPDRTHPIYAETTSGDLVPVFTASDPIRNAADLLGIATNYPAGDERFRRFFPGLSCFPTFRAEHGTDFSIETTAAGLTIGAHTTELFTLHPWLGPPRPPLSASDHTIYDYPRLAAEEIAVTIAGNARYFSVPAAWASGRTVWPKIFFAFLVHDTDHLTEITTVRWPHAERQADGYFFGPSSLSLDLFGLATIPLYRITFTTARDPAVDPVHLYRPSGERLTTIHLRASLFWEFRDPHTNVPLYDDKTGRRINSIPWTTTVTG